MLMMIFFDVFLMSIELLLMMMMCVLLYYFNSTREEASLFCVVYLYLYIMYELITAQAERR